MNSSVSWPRSTVWRSRTSVRWSMRPSSLPTDTIPRKTIYAAVRRRIPSISLATVYNNLRLFIECGLLREVTPHASTLRVDGNLKPHHHLVCSRCKSVQDIEGEFIDFNRLSRQLPGGFDLTQPLIEVFGLCRRCSAKT